MIEQKRGIRLLITGGGTGGHLFPAVAAAQALKKRVPASEVLFVGTSRKIDRTGLHSYGFRSCAISCYGLKGKTFFELIKALAILPVSFFQAALHIRRFRPDVALGVGGYVTGPVMAAARFLGVPTVIHEQNSIPGMANRKLASLVDKICLSLPGSENYFPKEKVEFTGNPVRQNILDSVDSAAGASQDKLTIAVLGGSQGARGVNDLVIEAFCGRTAADLVDVKLIHQTGQADYERVAAAYDVRRKGVEVAPFFEDMGAVYSRADLLVSRAGATTLTEAAVLGKPAILIPYPYAADNHQQKNGDYYVRGGGALQFAEKEFSGGALAAEIIRLAEDRSELARMKGAMKKLGCPQAAERIVDICLAAARPKR